MAEWFFNPNLVWLGLPLLALPIIIHLINLMRHRRVAWAAMEFVLVAHKKSSTWILLKQLLLLLLRILAIAAIIILLGQFLLSEDLRVFGTTTHHIVVVDDTYSMSDKLGETSVFDEAKSAVRKIGRWAASARTRQRFSLMLFSTAAPVTELNKVDVATDFDSTRLRSSLDSLAVSQASVSPLQALDAVAQQLSTTANERRVVYLVSDFRDRDWNASQMANLNERLAALTNDTTEIRLVHCVDREHANLGITALNPVSGSLAAGVGLEMEVRVRNYSNNPVRELSVLLLEDGRPRTPVVFEGIAGNSEASKRFVVRFDTPGQHTVTAQIASDAVESDNARFAMLNVPEGHPVLIVDGDQESSGGWFLANALDPGEVRTGLRPQIEKPQYLAEKPLDGFQSIYVTNFHQLPPAAVEALEEYVRGGGGVAFFMGPPLDETGTFTGLETGSLQRTLDFVARTNRVLHRDGVGLLPAPLAADSRLIADRIETTPDLVPEDHPIFRVFTRTGDAFLRDVKILSYYSLPQGWEPDPQSTTRVIARLRNGDPLALEQHFGARDSQALRSAQASLRQAAEQINKLIENPAGNAAANSKLKEDAIAQVRDAGERMAAALASLEAGSQRYGDSKPQLAQYHQRLQVLDNRHQTLAQEVANFTPPNQPADSQQPDLASRIKGLAQETETLAEQITSTEGPGGRVVVFLTTAGPIWNNWAANPSFVIGMLELQTYLASSRSKEGGRTVGAPIELRLDPEQYLEKYVLVTPQATIERAIAHSGDQLQTAITDTGTAGLYELQVFRRDGRTEPPQKMAFNVQPDEGDLRLLTTEDLTNRITADRVTVLAAGDVQGAASQSARSSLTEILLYVLIALLLGEQILAYALSYHPQAATKAAA